MALLPPRDCCEGDEVLGRLSRRFPSIAGSCAARSSRYWLLQEPWQTNLFLAVDTVIRRIVQW
jgi:hypothetical protein